MPEVWENPFANALLKIERANKHIAEIEERVRASADGYGPSFQMDSKTGEQFLYYSPQDETLRSDIALLVGDPVHNLHCALDVAYREAVTRVGTVGAKTKFPVLKTRKEGESALSKNAQIPESSPVFSFLVDAVKPYEGGDPDILALHALDIRDKHQLLIPMLTVTGLLGVELEHENGTFTVTDIILPRQHFYREPVPLGTKLKDHGQLAALITFRNGTPAEGLEVIQTLRRFSVKVEEIVLRLRSMT